MADLTARFSLIDEMSDKLSQIADAGQSAFESMEQIEGAADGAFSTLDECAVSAAQSCDGVATSISDLDSSAGDLQGSAADLSAAMDGLSQSASDVAQKTDDWTDAVGGYDKGMMEAVYSTQELVDMGLKESSALEDQEKMFGLCEKAAQNLSEAQEAATRIQEDLSDALDDSTSLLDSVADALGENVEQTEAFSDAVDNARAALEAQQEAQQDAQDAMEYYDQVLMSGTDDLNELESAAERAGTAAENLASANERAASAMGDLESATTDATRAVEENASQTEGAGTTGINAWEGISTALAAAGIAATVKEITQEIYNMAEAFSEAESTVVDATGATGSALDSLMDSTMAAYSSTYNGLDEVASAVGEINTRLGYTDDQLTETTTQFLNFANVTGGDATTAVQNVTKIMNKWGEEAGDMTTILDELTYAGQVSGQSVDSLSSTLISGAATFQAAGLSLENTISMLDDFELAGINTTTAVTALRTAVNNFTSDGLDANTALEETITKIAEMGDESEATALAVDTFGSKAGQELAAAIRNGTLSVDTFSSTFDDAKGTLESTAEASMTMSDKWTESTNKITAAFSEALSPMIENLVGKFSDLVGKIGDFLDEHPAVVKAITAIGTVLGVSVVALTGYTVATKLATAATKAFTAAIPGLNVIMGVVTGVTALVGVIAALSSNAKQGTYDLEDLTTAASDLDDTLSNSQATYDNTVESTEASAAAAETYINKLKQLESAGQASDEANSEYQNTIALLLQTEPDLEEYFTATTDQYGRVTYAADESTDALLGNVEAMKQQAIASAYQDEYNDIMSDYADVMVEAQQNTIKLQEAQDRLNEAQNQYDAAEWKMQHYDLGTDEWAQASADLDYWSAEMKSAQKDVDTLQEAIDDDNATLEEADQRISDLSDAYEDYYDSINESTEDASNEVTTWADVANDAYSSVQDQIEDLCQAYDDAYQAASDSFAGIFDLYDQAQANTETTIEDLMAAQQSQLDYWNAYNENLAALMAVTEEDTGITQDQLDTLLNAFSDGSEESAGMLQQIMSDIDSGNYAEVQQLADTMQQVEEARDQTAGTVADWQTDFSGQMEEFVGEMDDMIDQMVDDMDCSEEAGEVAKSVIDRYTSQITENGESAVQAAENIASRIQSALNISTTVSVSSSSAGYATGTTNSAANFVAGENGPELIVTPAHAAGTTRGENYYIAGENGPELIVGQPGSEVFPASETDRLINALEQQSTGPYISSSTRNNISTTYEGDRNTYEGDTLVSNVDNSRDIDYDFSSSRDRTYEYAGDSFSGLTALDDSISNLESSIEMLNSMLNASTASQSVAGDTISQAVSNNAEIINSLQEAVQSSTEAVDNSQANSSAGYAVDRIENEINSALTDIDSTVAQEGPEDTEWKDQKQETRGKIEDPTWRGGDTSTTATSRKEETKKITLEINGSGGITIDSSTNPEDVLEVLQANLKPVLMSLIKQEIYEEGEKTYVY